MVKPKGRLDGNQIIAKSSRRKKRAKALLGHRKPRRLGQYLKEPLHSRLKWGSSTRKMMSKMARVGNKIGRWLIDQILRIDTIIRKTFVVVVRV